MTWRADAKDSNDGTVASVEFFAINPSAPVFDSTTRLGVGAKQGDTSVYELQTVGLAAGNYTVVARATDDDGATTTSGSVNVVVNALPSITIDAPASGTIFLPGANLTLKATASDADGSVAKVEFFADGNKIGEDTTAPYEFTWAGVPAGPHTIQARATDNDGQTSSKSVTIGEDDPPVVTLVTPVAGPIAPATITLTATADDADGSVVSVTFANNGVSVGAGVRQGSSNVYKLVLTNQRAGSYAFTATATDDIGAASTTPSQPASVMPNTVSIGALPAGLLLPEEVVLTATVADSAGIARVEFWVDGAKVGEGSAASYAFTWTAATAGAHSAKAKAIDNAGSETESTTVDFEVVGPWSTLSTARKAGITLTPNRAIGADPGVDAGAVMTAIGVDTVAPKFVTAMAQGLRKLADLPLAVTGTTLGEAVDCPEGGKIAVFQLAGDERAIDLIDCKIGGFSFRGGGDFPIDQTYTESAPDNQCTPNGNLLPTVPPEPPRVCTWPSEIKYTQLSADSFRLVVKTVQVSGNGSPEKLNAPFPHNAYGYAYVECTVTNGVKSCLTDHENSFLWGQDLAWTGWNDSGTTALTTPLRLYATDDTYTLSGTLRQCEADPQPENYVDPLFCQTQGTAPAAYHIKFDNMKRESGRAILYGSNGGWSVVTRLAPEPPAGAELPPIARVQVLRNGAAQPLTYRCPVDSNGFYQCALVTP